MKKGIELRCKLALKELCIEAVLCNEGVMIALFDDIAVVHDKDEVSLLDGREAVCNDKGSTSLHHCLES